VTRAEPATEVAGFTQRNAPQVGANAHLDEPDAVFVHRSVLVRGKRAVGQVLVFGALIGQATDVDGPGFGDLGLGARTDEHRFPLPQNSQLRAGHDTAQIDSDRCEGKHVGRWVHLSYEGPDRGACGYGTGTGGGVEQKIAACALVVICV